MSNIEFCECELCSLFSNKLKADILSGEIKDTHDIRRFISRWYEETNFATNDVDTLMIVLTSGMHAEKAAISLLEKRMMN